MDTGQTVPDNYLKLCDVILERTVLMKQVLDCGEATPLTTRCIYECMRIYVMLEAQLFKCNMNPTEVESLLQRTELMFADMLFLGPALSSICFDELLKLGEVCSLLSSQVLNHGQKVLAG